MVESLGAGGLRRCGVRWVMAVLLGVVASGTATAANYEIDVNLAVQHHADMPNSLGSQSALEDVRVRLMAKTKIGWYAVWGTKRTDANGHVSFRKDKNTKKRRFRVKVMFQDDDLQIRQGNAAMPGTRKVKWYTVSEFGWTGRNKQVRRKENLVFGRPSSQALDDREPRHHAEIWNLYHTTIDYFADEIGSDYGFQKKIKVKYPHDTPLIGNVSASYANPHNKVIYLYKDSSGDAGRDAGTMIHELMHMWVYRQVRAERKMAGYLVANGTTHGPLKEQFVAFHEGVAEWLALKVLDEVFSDGPPHEPLSNDWVAGNIHYRTDDDLVVNGGVWKNVPRHDDGWEYILNLTSRPDVYEYDFGTTDSRLSRTRTAADLKPLSHCHSERLAFRELLDVFVKGSDWHTKNMTWDGFWTRVIDQNNGLSARDKRRYRAMTDPNKTAGEIDRSICMAQAKQAATEDSNGVGSGSGSGGGLNVPDGVDLKRPGGPPKRINKPDLKVRKPPEVEIATSFAGRWQTRFGELNLHQAQGYVIGDYADSGVMLGEVAGNCVAGVFTNAKRNGVFRFTKDGKDSFEGEWAWHGNRPRRDWDGQRKGAPAATLRNFTPDGQALKTRNNERTVFDGTYDSPFGTVALIQRDLFLVGDYGDKGIMAGLWDGNSFRGYFTNEGRTGWFDLAFLSKKGDFRSGKWNWVGSSQARDWTLDKSAGDTPSLDNITADVSCGG